MRFRPRRWEPAFTATDLTRGPGLTPISLSRGYSSQGWNNSGTTTTTRADAIAGNKYDTFSVTLSPNTTVSFSDITVGLYKSALASPASMEWQYSFDNFTTSTNTLAIGRDTGPLINGIITSVPEPATLGMAVAGAAFVGFSVFRRRLRDG